ncbi:MAG: hypothetical protein ABIA93_01925 [Candidatus Woesearchaeota archaeon]
MESYVTEGKAKLRVHLAEIPSREMPVFYNPEMRSNRDLTLWVLGALKLKMKDAAIPYAGSGVRGIRMLLELDNPPEMVHLNDISEEAIALMRENAEMNGVSQKIVISQREASRFLMDSKGFDFIDIDPFGTPVHVMKAAAQAIRENGIIAVNALDTAALSGTYPKTCLRRYWAVSLKCSLSKEIAMRILIRRFQLEAASFDKALEPIFSIKSKHFVRVFLKASKGADKANKMLSRHGSIFHNPDTLRTELSPFESGKEIGPLYTGPLWDKEVMKSMLSYIDSSNVHISPKEVARNKAYCSAILDDLSVDSLGFYDLHEVAALNGASPLSIQEALQRIPGSVKSSIVPFAIKSKLSHSEIMKRLTT